MMFARSFCVKSLVPPVSTHQTRSAQIQTDCPLEGDPGVDSAPAVFIIIAAAGALPPLHEYDERLQGLAASRRARCYFPLTCWASVLMCRPGGLYPLPASGSRACTVFGNGKREVHQNRALHLIRMRGPANLQFLCLPQITHRKGHGLAASQCQALSGYGRILWDLPGEDPTSCVSKRPSRTP